MTRRCSHCSNNGHNSRTCPTRGGGGGISGVGAGIKLFGVRLTDGSIMKKSASMGNLSTHYHNSSSSPGESPNRDSPLSDDQVKDQPDGYLSDDPAHGSGSGNRRGDRKKGIPWTEEEHRLFLVGLQKLGKGDWRGIARNYVVSRTPTQVASHAQKYFIRQSNATTRRKRRSSLFDLVPDDMATNTPTVPEEEEFSPFSQSSDGDRSKSIPTLNLSLNTEFDPMETQSQESIFPEKTPIVPEFFPFWSTSPYEEVKPSYNHGVLKPTPVFAKQLVNADELVGMSQLSIAEIERSHREPSPISLKLIGGESSRQSAFHANTLVSRSDINNGKCVFRQFEPS